MSKLLVTSCKLHTFHQISKLNILLKPKRKLATLIKPPEACNIKEEETVVALNNGQKIPKLGLGTWLSTGDAVIDAVLVALKTGYRMIDTAYVYENEKDIGYAIKEAIKTGLIKSRQDLWITSKLWNTFHHPKSVEKAISLSLQNLEVSYLDLYLMHWPSGYEEGMVLFPKNACGNTNYSDVDYIDTWKAMEKLVKKGLAKSIGIANFNKSQIERLLSKAEIPPAMLQVECHPYLNQRKLMDYCKSKQIAVTAYSPLGASSDRPYAVKGEKRLLQSKEIDELAWRYNKTLAQILIRYQIQRGNVCIPKSSTKSRIQSNFQIYNWKLSDQHMKFLDDMNRNYRYVTKESEFGTHKYYPFNDEF